VIVHNVGHMVFGPAEAFTPEQFAELYDVNVLSTQRVNRAAPASKARPRSAGLGVEQQRGRRYAALSFAILCSKGGHGSLGGALRARAGTLGR
jgi:NAD(P)-dependent dehydrogenase (short-subunit alcohol dehydrogenase family)